MKSRMGVQSDLFKGEFFVVQEVCHIMIPKKVGSFVRKKCMKSGGGDAGKHAAIVFYIQNKGFDVVAGNLSIALRQYLFN